MKQRHGRGTYSYFKAPSGEGDEEPEEETEGKTATAAATYTGDFRFGTKDGFGKMKYPNPNLMINLHVRIATSLHQGFPWLHPTQA